MEGTVTISIKDYLELKEKAESYEEQEELFNKQEILYIEQLEKYIILLNGAAEFLKSYKNIQEGKELLELIEDIESVLSKLYG